MQARWAPAGVCTEVAAAQGLTARGVPRAVCTEVAVEEALADPARPVPVAVFREVILAPVASQLPLLVLLDISQEPRQLIRHYTAANSHRPLVWGACPRVSWAIRSRRE